jgi:endonuclease/exonuclease/phosphatase (EEP) superfamily protein YafD
VTDKKDQGANAPEVRTALVKRKRRTAYIGCFLGLGVGLGGLALSRLGQLWIAFDVFSQFTLHFIIIAFAFAASLFMPRAKILTATALVIASTAALSIWPYYASRHVATYGEATAQERVLKVASFNTWFENKNTDLVVAEVSRIDADVVTLIEMGPNANKIIDALKNQYPFQVNCFAQVKCDMSILSKYALDNLQYKSEWLGPEYIRASLGEEFGGLTIFGVHTTRFPYPRAQFKQIKAMSAEVEKTSGSYIVMGDFNATPFSRITQTLALASNLKRLTNLPTWPARLGMPQLAIDHIFVSEGIRQLESESIGENAGSDHFPITMKLAVPIK